MDGTERLLLFALTIAQLRTAHGIERVASIADLWFTADGDRWLVGMLLWRRLLELTPPYSGSIVALF